MAFDLEEQEQLATIKAWWNQYGNAITWLLIIAMAGVASWYGWKNYQTGQASQASMLYEELQKAVTAKDNVKVQRAATDMEAKFSGTAYAQMSALVAAKSAVDANDLGTAKAQLQWIIAGSGDDEFKSIAKLRLAGLLLDEKAFDAGLKLLDSEFPEQFASAVADRKGDILVAQNQRELARAAYQTALDKSDAKNPGRQLIQLKLDAVGGAPAKAVSTTK